MYSGSDSTGSQNYNQWPLNPAAYQNTPNEQIDWAALAQQWIIMKEAGPPVLDQITTTMPPSNIQKVKKDNLSEGGEAPMEVENDKEEDAQPHWNDNTSSAEGSWNWNQQQQWGWGNTWSAPSGVPPPGAAKAPLLPTPPAYNQYSGPNENTSNFGGYNRPSSEYSGGYWTASGNKMKPHNKRYSKVNVPPRPPIAPAVPEPVMLDASKRKQLPAWIREGLEKMERDKQKQLEKEREKLEKDDQKEKSKLNEKEALEIIKSTVKERERSKFESDGEDSEMENSNKPKIREVPESVLLTQEELMLKVRRAMTEILLKVTNQEIRAVCKEEFQRHLRKYKASDLRVSASSGTNIRAKLGLGIYGDSGSSSEDSGDESDKEKNDSDAELKDTIKRRKAEFSKTEREIEERLAAAERHIDDDSRGGTPKADDCDSQVDAKSQGHKTKLSEDVTPPKIVSSLSKRFKGRRTSTSSSTKSDSEQDKYTEQKEKKSVRTKKSSSTESTRSQKPTKTRNKRSHSSKDTRSITPERKKVKEKIRHSNDRKPKHSESSSSKSSSSRSRKSRSKSVELTKKRSRSTEKCGRDHTNNKRSYSKRSHSRSSSRSRRSTSYTRSHRSQSRARRSRSYTKSDKSRKSRSRTRSERSLNSRSRTRSERSHKSRSRDRRSRSTNRSRTSRSRHRSKSYSPRTHRHRRLKSRSSSRDSF